MKIGMIDLNDCKIGSTQIQKVYQGTNLVWEKQQPITSGYLRFTANAYTMIYLYNYGSNNPNIQYRLNGTGNWITMGNDTRVTIPENGYIELKGNNPNGFSKSGTDYTTFIVSTGSFNVSGNIMSLIDGVGTATSIPSTFCFSKIFSSLPIVDASQLQLPATTLAQYCYSNMFNGCTSLTSAPSILPATTLAQYCYSNMFADCASLTSAPELPATTLVQYCYNYMFKGCTSLTTAPELPATTLANWCYKTMFANCTKLTTAPSILPATTLADECYSSMFQGCTSLTTAPELPATTLAYGCYMTMFYNCTKLKNIKCLATNISATDCTYNWLYNVSSSGTFVKASSMNNWTRGANGIPSNWTIENA